MKQYILSPEAAEDLREIRAYLKRKAGPRVAKSVLLNIKDALTFLGDAPGAGHSREDLTSDPVKFWSVFSYMIIYRTTSTPIEIVRVLHGARDISAILENSE